MVPDVVVLEREPWLAVTVDTLCEELDGIGSVVALSTPADLAVAGPVDVVVAGPSLADAAGMTALAAHVARNPGTQVVLAVDGAPDVALPLLLAVNARALVDPADAWALGDALEDALERAHALAALLGTASDEQQPDTPGRVLTVCSPTGGSGKTFYASNLAYLLAATGDVRVALVDLDLQFGEVSAAMRVRGRHSLADAVAIRDEQELADYLPELLVEHGSGVLVLPAPRDPADADRIEPQDVGRVVRALQRHADVVVVDTPTGLTEPVLAALDVSDHLFVLASLDLASLRNLRLFTDTLQRLRVDDAHVSLVLNKEARDTGIDVDDLLQVFPRGFASRVPFDREVTRLMNLGTPVLEGAEQARVSAALVEGLLPFLDDDAAEVARERWLGDAPRGVRALLRRLRRSATPDLATSAPEHDTEPVHSTTGSR